ASNPGAVMTDAVAHEVGERARPFDLVGLDGRRVHLDDLREQAFLLIFLRHAGGLICRAHLVKVLHHPERIDELGTVLFVAFDRPERLRDSLLRGLDVPYPVLVDPERSAYRAWGLASRRCGRA